MKRNLPVLAIVAVAVAAMLWYGVHRAPSKTGPAGEVGAATGQFAPDFKLQDVRTGQGVELSEFKGKAILLNFWATWCAPCKLEIPWFVDLQKHYGAQGLQVVGIAMDDAGAVTIAKFANEMNVNYPVLQGTEKVANLYGGVDGLPVTFYIARDGRVVKQVVGVRSRSDVEDIVQSVLRSGQTAGIAQQSR